jgi:hypothetical protein
MLHSAKPRVNHVQIFADLPSPNIGKSNMIRVFFPPEVILIAEKRGVNVD